MTGTEEISKVVVFDLNKTFYLKSSKDEFFKFVAAKKPGKLRYYGQMLYYNLLLKLHRIRQTEFKENFFNYLNDLSPAQVEAYAKEFWQKEFPAQFNKNLMRRLDQLRSQGVQVFCATGGLELYVRPLFDLYPVDGFAGTQVKYIDNTYLIEGKACKGEEKVKRLSEHFEGRKYDLIEAYSDSKEPILDQAEKAYLIKHGKIAPYYGA